MATILLVEDESELADDIARSIKRFGYQVQICHNGHEACQILDKQDFDLIIMDWGLPDVSGIDVMRSFREKGGKTGILFLTGRGGTENIVTGLEQGADDYLVKPFLPDELIARINALLRRPKEILPEISQLGDLSMDRDQRIVYVRNKVLDLTNREYQILEFLLRHPNSAFNSQQLLTSIWSSLSESGQETVRSQIRTLRQKLANVGLPDLIETLKGGGYIVRTASEKK